MRSMFPGASAIDGRTPISQPDRDGTAVPGAGRTIRGVARRARRSTVTAGARWTCRTWTNRGSSIGTRVIRTGPTTNSTGWKMPLHANRQRKGSRTIVQGRTLPAFDRGRSADGPTPTRLSRKLGAQPPETATLAATGPVVSDSWVPASSIPTCHRLPEKDVRLALRRSPRERAGSEPGLSVR